MKFTCLLICLSSLIGTTMVHASNLQCPTTIAVKESVMNQKDWENTGFPSAKTLKSSTLFLGKLGDSSSALAPEQQEKNKKLLQTWNLKPYHDQDESVWLECQYFETEIKLRRIVPSNMNTCGSTFVLDAAHNPKSTSPLSCR